MPELTHSIYVQCSPEVAFNYMTDFRNDAEWWVQSLSAEKLTKGDIGVGTKFNQISAVGFVKVKSTIRVTEIAPNTKYQFVNESNQLEYKVTYLTEQEDDGCKVTMIASMDTHGILKLVWPITKKVIDKQIEQNFKNLKRQLETKYTA